MNKPDWWDANREFLIHVYVSGGTKKHLVMQSRVSANMGTPWPGQPPTDAEMQSVVFAAKMALAKVILARKHRRSAPKETAP